MKRSSYISLKNWSPYLLHPTALVGSVRKFDYRIFAKIIVPGAIKI